MQQQRADREPDRVATCGELVRAYRLELKQR